MNGPLIQHFIITFECQIIVSFRVWFWNNVIIIVCGQCSMGNVWPDITRYVSLVSDMSASMSASIFFSQLPSFQPMIKWSHLWPQLSAQDQQRQIGFYQSPDMFCNWKLGWILGILIAQSFNEINPWLSCQNLNRGLIYSSLSKLYFWFSKFHKYPLNMHAEL